MAIDDALVEVVTEVADKVIDIDLGASQAQGGLTTHGDEVFALSTIKASIVEVSDLFGIATGEHLVDQLVIVSCIIGRVELLKLVPVVMKDLFKYIPYWNEFSIHSSRL
jgi:hypothetical protein